MKKKIIVSVICIVIVAVWAARVYSLNASTQKPAVKNYNMNEWVQYGDDFFYRSDRENRNGYEIKVTDVNVIKYDDYLKNHNLKVIKGEGTYTPERIFDVTVIIKNIDNTESGITMLDTTLNSVNDRLSIDYEVFDALYPQLSGSVSFSIKPGTEMEFHFPFAVSNEEFEEIYTEKYINSASFHLNISQYPIEKNINIVL